MTQRSGQFEPAEQKDGVQQPEAVSAPEPEKEGEPEPLSPDAPPAPEPEDPKAPEKEDDPAPEKQNDPAPKKNAPSGKKAPHGKKAPPKKRPPKSTGRLLIDLLIKIAVTVAVIWATLTFVLGLSAHYGNNMYPAVHDGDLLISFRLQKPFINAVVLYKVDGKTDVGRVIAMEGSVVDIAANGLLTVNGVAPSTEIFYATYQADGSPISFPYTVEPGKVFILNDFREDTNDSRVFGAVDKNDLEGPLLLAIRRRNF